MIDFSRLKVPTREEQAEIARRKLAEAIEADTSRRAKASKIHINATLQSEAETRRTLTGGMITYLRCLQANGRPLLAVYFVPEHLDDDEMHRHIEPLQPGRELELAGYWKKRTWRNQSGESVSSWEFMAQTFSLGRN